MKKQIIGNHLLKFLPLLLLLLLLYGCQTVTPESVLPVDAAELSTQTPAASTATAVPPSPTSLPTHTASPTPPPSATSSPSPTPLPSFRFVVNGDPANHAGEGEMDTPQFFRGMAEHIASLPETDFMITVGDTTPPWEARWTIDRYLGEDYLWYPVLGNHELYENDMNWLRAYDYDQNGSASPNIVNPGPVGCEETTFSFDHKNTHFVILNVYCDLDNDMRTDGAIVDHLYDWLQQDLENTTQDHILVFGHEPAFPQPDAENGIIRHLGDSLDQYPITRDRFWSLLQEHDVVAYFTGHTHSYSVVDIDGVWQVDTAHSMGARTQATRSTFIVIEINGGQVNYLTYRVNNFTDVYEQADAGSLR